MTKIIGFGAALEKLLNSVVSAANQGTDIRELVEEAKEDLINRFTNVTAKNTELRKENEQLRQRIAELEAEVVDLKESLKSAEEELEAEPFVFGV